ncbi:MAG: GntR family transcriptional regulator [Firmicutes bacterium]|nr:GntR family transcriptional regulator [Bacillota bacterium]
MTEQYKEDQLLSTRELSDEFGISGTPVMQALRRLAYEGFIDDIYQTVSKSIEHFIY